MSKKRKTGEISGDGTLKKSNKKLKTEIPASITIPWFHAVKTNNTKNMKSLLEKSSNIDLVNSTDQNGLTALYYAAEKNLEAVKLLIESGADLMKTDNSDITALHRAAQNGQTEIVKYLITSGAAVDSEDYIGQTPLHQACENGHYDIAKILIDNKTEVDKLDYTYCSPLFFAAGSDLKTLKLLIENGAQLYDEENGKPLISLLTHAAEKGKNDIIDYLLSLENYHADLTDEEDQAALHFASIIGQYETVKFLIEHGANIDLVDGLGCSALHHAVERNKFKITKLLIKKGIDVNLTDAEGRTALHYAAMNGDVKTIQLLLENNANINAQDESNSSALHIAVEYRKFKVASLLIEKGINVNLDDEEGKTAIDLYTEYFLQNNSDIILPPDKNSFYFTQCKILGKFADFDDSPSGE